LPVLSRNRRVLLAAIVVVVLGGGALGSYYVYQLSLPTVVSVGLRNGAKEVDLQPKLRLSATRPVTASDLEASLRMSPKVDAEVRASDGGRLFTWRPRKPLAELTEYTLSLQAVRDSSGHQIKPAHFRFTTTIVPRIVSLTTEGGVPVPDKGEILAGSRLNVGFNDRMDTGSVKLLANGNPVGLTWAGDARSAALASQPLAPGLLELALAKGSRDSEGRPAADWSIHASVIFHVDIHTVPLRAPALIQVPNDPAARDQSGLQAADVVYEYLTEADITRFTAVFSRAPDAVGPIRSGRLISFALTRHTHGMLFMSGLSNGSILRLEADPVPHVIDVPGIFYRTGNRAAPNNLFVRAASLQQNEERAGVPASSLPHGPVPIVDGDPAATVAVPEHHSTYAFDTSTSTYTKTEEGHDMADAALNQPLRIQLLVIMHTTAKSTNYVEDVNGVHGLDFDMESGGTADFYYGGHHKAGKWSVADRHSPFTFQLDDGSVVKLPQGLAWVDVVKS
jgi:hypothetical protein